MNNIDYNADIQKNKKGIPKSPSGIAFDAGTRWVQNLSHNLIKSVGITFDGVTQQTYNSDEMDFWNKFQVPKEKQVVLYKAPKPRAPLDAYELKMVECGQEDQLPSIEIKDLCKTKRRKASKKIRS